MKLSKLFVTTLFLVLALSVTVYAKKNTKKEVKVPPVPETTIEARPTQKGEQETKAGQPKKPSGFDQPSKSSSDQNKQKAPENVATTKSAKSKGEAPPPAPTGAQDSKKAIVPKEEIVPPAPTGSNINYNVNDFLNPKVFDIAAFLGQYTERFDGVMFYNAGQHRFEIIRGTSKHRDPGVDSVIISLAADSELQGKDHPVSITVTGGRAWNGSGARNPEFYKRTFTMPDQWGEQIKLAGYDEYIYSSQLVGLSEVLVAITTDPTGNDLDQSPPSLAYRNLVSEKVQE